MKKPRKFMVRCDIEGASGVVSYEQAEPGKEEYDFGHRMFMADLVALVDGLSKGGANEVVIYDEHCSGRNIDLAQLPPLVSAICGKPPYTPERPGGLDESFAGAILLGFHSKAGTPGGLLPHSYELDIRDLRLNNVSVGEIGMEAAIAGDFGVPVTLVIGDSAGVAEARELLPGVAAVAVKDSLGPTSARCYPLSVTGPMISKAARQVAEETPEVEPYRIEAPVTLEVELADGPYLEAVRKLYGGEMREGRTMVLTDSGASEVWADYWQRKLRAQGAMRAMA